MRVIDNHDAAVTDVMQRECNTALRAVPRRIVEEFVAARRLSAQVRLVPDQRQRAVKDLIARVDRQFNVGLLIINNHPFRRHCRKNE